MRMRYTKRDVLALLAHLAHEADRITEAEFAVLLGVDLIEARDVLIAGRDLADERSAALARRGVARGCGAWAVSERKRWKLALSCIHVVRVRCAEPPAAVRCPKCAAVREVYATLPDEGRR